MAEGLSSKRGVGNSIAITAKFSIAGQVTIADFASISAAGFTAVINNRPDGEEPSQPSVDDERGAAAAAGMTYTHIPITRATLSEAAVREFQAALAAAPGPVFAHCKSGTRSLMLYAIGEVLDGRMAVGDVEPFGEQAGIDLSAAARWLEAR